MDTGDDVLSIIGPGMKIVGDLETRGSVRVEGVIEGTVQAGKAVVIGREGTIKGDVLTEDAVLAGTVQGTIRARSRLEVEATARMDGEIYAKTLKLDEGAVLNGQVRMGESAVGAEGMHGKPKAGNGPARDRSKGGGPAAQQELTPPPSAPPGN